MLDIKEIKKILREGKDVVVVGKDGTLHHVTEWAVENSVYKLKVGAGQFISERNFDKFHMIDALREDNSVVNKDNPTFNDLIDVAVQAYKDGIADEIILNDYISISTPAATYGASKMDTNGFEVMETIEKINSLYTETFVIESESDTNRLISGGKTVLKNGEVLEFSNNDNGYLWFNFNDYESEIFPFVALKGATVTQKRGK